MVERDCDKFKMSGAVLNFKDSTARSMAEDSASVASGAKISADSAAGKADAAQTTADSALSKADVAQTTADSAVSKADAAQSTADSAVSKADVAQSTADSTKKGFSSQFVKVDGNLADCYYCKRNGTVCFMFNNVKLKGQLLANTWTAVTVLPTAARPIANVFTNVMFGNLIGLCQVAADGKVQLYSQNAIGQNVAVYMTVSYPGTL